MIGFWRKYKTESLHLLSRGDEHSLGLSIIIIDCIIKQKNIITEVVHKMELYLLT
jgi:hypothetical protein